MAAKRTRSRTHSRILIVAIAAAIVVGAVALFSTPGGATSPGAPSADATSPPGSADSAVMPSGPDSPVSSTPDQVRVPDLRGMTVAAAKRRLRSVGLKAEPGTVLSRQPGTGALLKRGSRAGRKVTAQSPPPRSYAIDSTRVALGTAGGNGALKVAGLEEVLWRSTSFARGILSLGGFDSVPAGGGLCGVVDHATIRGSGAQRLLKVWVVRFEIDPRLRMRCIPPARARLKPEGNWNRRTVGWPSPLDEIRPGLPDANPIPFQRAVLQPDRRRVLVTYWHGACDALTRTETKFSANGRRAHLTLLFGRTVPADRACPAIAIGGASLIRLPRQVNPGTRFIPVRNSPR